MSTYHTQTIPELLSTLVSRHSEHPFLESDSSVLTYTQFDTQTLSLAAHFVSLGIKQGNHVAILLPNCSEFILSWFALMRLGAVMVPINPTYQEGEVAYIISHSESRFVITQANLASHLSLDITIILTSSLATLPAPQDLPSPDITPESLAAILYTSGTTGKPKGVMLPHRSFTIGGESFAYRAQLSHTDRMLVMLPLFHVNAEVYSVMGGLVAGATLVLVDSFHASTFWQTVHDRRITQFNFLGVIANILLRLPASPLDTTHHLRLCCGAGLSKETILAFRDRFHVPLLETYGLTEAPMGLSNMLDDSREGSIGKPARHSDPTIFTQAKLVDNEIVLSTPALALGYWGNKDATQESFQNNWFYTGDYGRQDRDGYYYFVDRKKDLIRKKGENISSREIELVIANLPGVVSVAVIPIPSPLGEDDIKAYIVTQPGSNLNFDLVRAHCLKQLSYQKTPALVEFVESLPQTPTNKVAKQELKLMFQTNQSHKLTPRMLLVDGLRTPIAKMDGAFKDIRPDELLTHPLNALAKRLSLTHADDFIVGCVNQLGEAQRNIARQAILLSDLSSSTPATTINRLSASSLEAARLAFATIASGLSDSVLVGGVESFSRTKESDRLGYPHLHPKLTKTLLPSGVFMESLAQQSHISRSDQDEYALLSNERSLNSPTPEARGVIPVAGLDHDDIPRSGLALDRLSNLPPLFAGTITAGNSSKLGDSAGVLLMASPSLVATQSWQPLAGIIGFSLFATDPKDYGSAPVSAIRNLLNQHDLTIDHIGIWEIHEAYAAEALYVARQLRLSPSRINLWGGAVSLGHPFGATGVRLLLSAAHQLASSDSSYAVVSICIGGGQALACLLTK